jgi:hypothetical protein
MLNVPLEVGISHRWSWHTLSFAMAAECHLKTSLRVQVQTKVFLLKQIQPCCQVNARFSGQCPPLRKCQCQARARSNRIFLPFSSLISCTCISCICSFFKTLAFSYKNVHTVYVTFLLPHDNIQYRWTNIYKKASFTSAFILPVTESKSAVR